MASWSGKRQQRIILVVIAFGLIIFGIPAYYKFFPKKATCFDNVLNQDEIEADCGGVCQKLCSIETKDPLVLYERFFATAPGVYSLLANIENSNQGAYATDARYIFRTYDKNNVLLDERSGQTYIAPNTTFPIMEYGIFLGERIPAKTIVSFIQPIDWRRGEFNDPSISILNIKTNQEGLPFIGADLKSNEVYEIKNIRVIAIVYDVLGNAIGTSQTVVLRLAPKESVPIAFSWNKPFEASVSRVDIIPRVLPRDIK